MEIPPGMSYRCRNNRDRTLEFVGEGCLDLTGYRPEDLLSDRKASYTRLIHPEDRAALWSAIQAALREERPFQHAYRLITASGEERWVWERGGGVSSPEGELLAIEGLVTDIAGQLQGQQAAVAAERNRLARDLHDDVTQPLFSANLIAEVLPQLWKRDPTEAWRRLEELRRLTRGALSEMRALLSELRPTALEKAKLGELLRHLAEAVADRSRVSVSLTVDDQYPLPAEVQVALYRIAQEALNNMAKHSGASRATVELQCRAEGARLRIADDGCGFDPKAVSPERLGLGIMYERAEAIGATLGIETERGHGTQIVVDWANRDE